MLKVNYDDKKNIVEILCESFDTNKSINFVIKNDSHRKKRIQLLMEYSFDICFMFGNVYFSEDKQGCALLLYPEKKRTTLKTILLDLKLAIFCVGITRIFKILNRESKIKSNHPKEVFHYLWFLGVKKDSQNKGIGRKLIEEVIELSNKQGKDIYLETSTIKNIPWYEKFGFKVIKELDLTYNLFILKKSK